MKTRITLTSGLVVLAVASLSLSAPVPIGEKPQEKAILKGHIGMTHGLVFSPNGQILVSGGADGTIRLWDVASGKNEAIFRHPPDGMRPFVYAVAISPDGRKVASQGDNTIRLWDTITGKNTEARQGFSQDLVFSPDGKKVVITQARVVWDLETKKDKPILEKAKLWRPIAAFGTKGRLLIADIERSEQEGAPDGLTLALWDADTGKKTMTLKGHTGSISCWAFSPDRKILASASHDMTVRLWETDSGKNTATFPDLPGYPFGLAFSPNGKVLACGYLYQGRDGTRPRLAAVALYETATGKTLATLKGEAPGPLSPVVFSPDGRTFAAGTFDSIRLWRLPTRYATDE